MHVPVLLQEVIAVLQPTTGKKYIDATAGGGGHTKMLLKQGSKVLALDRDPEAVVQLRLDLQNFVDEGRLSLAVGNFAQLASLPEVRTFVSVDGILLDLGLSSNQLDDPQRGFAFQKAGPLDMRFASGTKNSVGKELTAGKIVNFYPEEDLIRIFYKYGEEKRFGKRIARAILLERKTKNLTTTTELFELIKQTLPAKFRFRAGDTARRIFQSLRIAVNDELTSLEKALPQALLLLKSGGRLAVISFHSLEDRIVKQYFAQESRNCLCPPSFPVCQCGHKAQIKLVTKKPITSSDWEIKDNPRAHSAKLRVAEKLKN